jgi:hypothetical protein
MAAIRIARDAKGGNRRRFGAIAAALGCAGLALLANAGNTAAKASQFRLPLLGAIGPGKLGELKSLKLDSEGKAPASIDAVARRALPGSPLAFEPFFGVAAAAFREKTAVGSARDAALLQEALRRNPRSREARLLLLRHALGTGKLGEAIDQIAVLNRLTPGAADQLMAGLGGAIRSPRQVDEAVDALKPHPELYRPFLRGFKLARQAPELAIRLVSRLPEPALADPVVRKMAIEEMVEAKAFAEARALWGKGLGKPGQLVHSPDFSDSKAPPPFNWTLAESESGVAERDRGGGLLVDYYGRSPGLLASQLLTLAPGSYTARLEYSTEAGNPSATVLQVSCAGSPAPLALLPLDAMVGASRTASLAFTVPAEGCKGQVLGLAGRVQERRDPQTLLVRRLDAVRGGGQ